MSLDDFLDTFNLIDRIEGWVSSVVHADWKSAAKTPLGLGFAVELTRSVVGAGAWTFEVPRDSGWTGADVESLLLHYGIIAWGRRVTGQNFVLSVKERQANWAEYLILRRGIPLDSPLFNPDNAQYTKKYAPGDRPPAWADRGSAVSGTVDKLSEWL